MARLTRKQAEARRPSVLNLWLANLDATGDEALAALQSGRLTGEPGR